VGKKKIGSRTKPHGCMCNRHLLAFELALGLNGGGGGCKKKLGVKNKTSRVHVRWSPSGPRARSWTGKGVWAKRK
jgi:hypothetical protein